MDIPLKKLLRLLEPGQSVRLRCAAVVVLGEVGSKDDGLAGSLARLIEDEEVTLRLEAIRAVGKLKIDQAMPKLLERIKVGGAEAEAAAEAVAHLGARGARALQELMPRVAPGLRRYIASALGAGGTTSSETAAVSMLLDSDPGVVEAAARSLVSQVPGLSPAHRREMAEHLLELLGDRDRRLSAISESAVVRLLAVLDDPRIEAVLWDRVLPPHAAEIRATALQALGKWVKSPSKDQLRRLISCAADRSFQVAAPALVILQHLPVNDRQLGEWLPLFEAPDVAVRRFAIERVGDRDRPEVAEALLQQTEHPDRKLREDALVHLTRGEEGRKALVQALLEASTSDRLWLLVRGQAAFFREQEDGWRDPVFTQACKYLEAEDRRADPLWFLLRETGSADLRDRLEKRGLALRKKKAYDSAQQIFRLAARDPACGFPIRVELACCELKVSSKDLAPDARGNDPALEQIVRLAHSYPEELMEYLEKAKWLEPEDLYYAGFHLAEQEAALRQLGGRILQLVAKRSPRSKLAQAAKSKLRSEVVS